MIEAKEDKVSVIEAENTPGTIIDRDILLHILRTKDEASERLSTECVRLKESIRVLSDQLKSKENTNEVRMNHNE